MHLPSFSKTEVAADSAPPRSRDSPSQPHIGIKRRTGPCTGQSTTTPNIPSHRHPIARASSLPGIGTPVNTALSPFRPKTFSIAPILRDTDHPPTVHPCGGTPHPSTRPALTRTPPSSRRTSPCPDLQLSDDNKTLSSLQRFLHAGTLARNGIQRPANVPTNVPTSIRHNSLYILNKQINQ